MCLALLTVIGVLISDLLLAVLDPRIRLAGGVER
jgi:peptide/nickel transport system permease protein